MPAKLLMVQNAPLAPGTRAGFRTQVLLPGPEERGREGALQLKRMWLPGGNGEGKQGKNIMAEDRTQERGLRVGNLCRKES